MQVHLFDIDVPGKITFQESKTLSPGDSFSTFDTRTYQISLPLIVIPERRSRYFSFLCLSPSFSHIHTKSSELSVSSPRSRKVGENGNLGF